MHPIDIRLADRQASLAGITRALHPQLARMAVSRVELHYSSQAPAPLPLPQVRQKIAQLLREHGQPLAQVSVHRHAGAIDDASGEHLLRLLPAATVRHDAETLPCLAARLRRLLGLGARPAAPAARQEPGPAAEAPAAPVPSISAAQAVRLLAEAVAQGASFVDGAANADDLGAGIAQAVVTARVPALHQVLEPLVRQDAASIGRMVAQRGLRLAPGFTVQYRFRPQTDGDGTRLANESDLDVRLTLAGTRPASSEASDPALEEWQAAGACDASALPWSQPPAGSAGVDQTAMPDLSRPTAVLRVLGTADAPFEHAFELVLGPLPTQLTRTVLECAGFGRVQPLLLAVASNQCPLQVQMGADGAPKLMPAVRRAADGGEQPMYFNPGTREPLRGPQAMPDGRRLVLVNHPDGVRVPGVAQRLPALLVEVAVRNATPTSAATMRSHVEPQSS